MKKYAFIGLLTVLTAMNTFAQIDYAGALDAAITFFDANRCGPDAGKGNAFSWRGACHVDDAVTGGYHDAGDHVKFGLPQCWSAATLAWAYYEYPTAFAPVKDKFFRMFKWFTDYFLACHTSADVFYYGFGDGNADHGYWGAPEAQTGSRPARKAPPGADVCAQGAAALALASLIYKGEDDAYSKKCLDAAAELYALALANAGSTETGRCTDGAGGNFYKSSSHYDDMCWGGIWLYTATGKSSYLDPIEEWTKIPNDPGDNHYQKKWSPAWDDVILFVLLKMAEITGKDSYYQAIVWNLEWCRDVCNKSPAGMPVIDVWGVLRYASAEAGLGYTAYRLLGYDGFNTLGDFIIDYCLGKNPENRSYLTGWGRNPPIHPHHRANEPVKGGAVKGIIGALVGGPTDDSYKDDVGNFEETEVALDYNASFIFGLAGYLYFKNGGKPKNRAPSVSITSPIDGISVPEGATISIKVVANDADGKVTKVELYEGENLLNSQTTSPLIYEWENTGAGEVTFKAIATDDSGKVSNPSKVTISFTGPCTPGEMLTRAGWVATASHASQNAGEGPSSALDGEVSTRWGSGTGQTDGMWFQLDMGYPRDFDQIVLDATGSGNDFPRSYKVYVTDDTSELGSAIASGTGTEKTVITLSQQARGQYIRIVNGESNGQWWSIHELNVPCAGSGVGRRAAARKNKASFQMDAASRNKSVLVNYSVPERGWVTIEECSLAGSRLRVLVDGLRKAGNHSFTYNTGGICSKMVLLKISYKGGVLLKRVILVN